MRMQYSSVDAGIKRSGRRKKAGVEQRYSKGRAGVEQIYTFVPEAPGGFIQIKENKTHISTVPYSVQLINQLARIIRFSLWC